MPERLIVNSFNSARQQQRTLVRMHNVVNYIELGHPLIHLIAHQRSDNSFIESMLKDICQERGLLLEKQKKQGEYRINESILKVVAIKDCVSRARGLQGLLLMGDYDQ